MFTTRHERIERGGANTFKYMGGKMQRAKKASKGHFTVETTQRTIPASRNALAARGRPWSAFVKTLKTVCERRGGGGVGDVEAIYPYRWRHTGSVCSACGDAINKTKHFTNVNTSDEYCTRRPWSGQMYCTLTFQIKADRWDLNVIVGIYIFADTNNPMISCHQNKRYPWHAVNSLLRIQLSAVWDCSYTVYLIEQNYAICVVQAPTAPIPTHRPFLAIMKLRFLFLSFSFLINGINVRPISKEDDLYRHSLCHDNGLKWRITKFPLN